MGKVPKYMIKKVKNITGFNQYKPMQLGRNRPMGKVPKYMN